MANFALIDKDNVVIMVTPIAFDKEADGIDFLFNTLNIKKIYPEVVIAKMTDKAGIGFTYNEDKQVFISPQPFKSWVLSGVNWEAPKPYPNDGKFYIWNEELLQWEELKK